MSTNIEICKQLRLELAKLSKASRDTLLADIDGTRPMIFQEDAPVVDDRIRMLEDVLSKMTAQETESYHQAKRQWTTDGSDSSTRALYLRFLRAEVFQAGLAAHRLTQYFDLAKRLFGPAVLGRPIQITDLTDDDIEAFATGGFQILQRPDRAGRKICFHREWACDYKSVDSMLRAIFYTIDMASRDEEVQIKGIVSLRHCIGIPPDRMMDVSTMLELESFLRFAAPLRVVGIHVASDSMAALDTITPTMNMALSRELMLRLVVHHVDSHAAFLEEMSAYGFPRDYDPLSENGDMKLAAHLDWLRSQLKTRDSHGSPTQAVVATRTLPQAQGGSHGGYADVAWRIAGATNAHGGADAAMQILAMLQNASTGQAARLQPVPAHIQLAQQQQQQQQHHQLHLQLQRQKEQAALLQRLGVQSTLAPMGTVTSHSTTQLSNMINASARSGLQGGVTGMASASRLTAIVNVEGIEIDKKLRPTSLPTLLFLESDLTVLSAYQCLLRQQIEVFEATEEDLENSTARLNRVIHLKQVGLRCCHCMREDEWKKAPGSVYYPGGLGVIYQVGQNIAKNHLLQGCSRIPETTKAQLLQLRSEKSRASVGKRYWKAAAIFAGLYEDEEREGSLFFRREPSE